MSGDSSAAPARLRIADVLELDQAAHDVLAEAYPAIVGDLVETMVTKGLWPAYAAGALIDTLTQGGFDDPDV